MTGLLIIAPPSFFFVPSHPHSSIAIPAPSSYSVGSLAEPTFKRAFRMQTCSNAQELIHPIRTWNGAVVCLSPETMRLRAPCANLPVPSLPFASYLNWKTLVCLYSTKEKESSERCMHFPKTCGQSNWAESLGGFIFLCSLLENCRWAGPSGFTTSPCYSSPARHSACLAPQTRR